MSSGPIAGANASPVAEFLPSRPAAVGAGPPDHSPPGAAAVGGDYCFAVEAAAGVVVVVVQVFLDELQAVLAAPYLGGVVCVDC